MIFFWGVAHYGIDVNEKKQMVSFSFSTFVEVMACQPLEDQARYFTDTVRSSKQSFFFFFYQTNLLWLL